MLDWMVEMWCCQLLRAEGMMKELKKKKTK